MGQEAIDGILRALAQGHQAYQHKQELILEKQRADAQTEAEQARIKQQQEELGQRKDEAKEIHKQWALQHELTKKAADLALQMHMTQLAKDYQATGVQPAGVNMSSAASSLGPGGEANYTPTKPNQGDYQIMTLPGMGQGGSDVSMQVAKPEVAATRQANLQRILDQPKIEMEAAKQGAETTRQIEVETARAREETKRYLEQIKLTQDSENKRNTERINGENYRTKLETTSRETIANMPYQLFNNATPAERASLVDPSIEAMNNGTMSAKQVHDEFNSKGMQGGGMAVVGGFMKNGGIPPTDKQVTFNTNVKPIIDTLPLIQQYINMLPKTSNGLTSRLAGISNADIINPELEALYKQIEFNIATVAKNLSGDQGQRLQKALLEPAQGGYLPNKYRPTTANISNFNKLVDVLNSAVDAVNGSMGPGQRAHIKNNLGLSNYGHLDLNGQPMTKSQSVPGVSNQIPQRESIESIWKRTHPGVQ